MAFNADEFSEEDFDELIEAESPEEEEEKEAPKKKRPVEETYEEEEQEQQPKRKAAPVQTQPKKNVQPKKQLAPFEEEEYEETKPTPRPAVAKPKTAPQVQRDRYVGYISAKRYGIMDNTTGQPYIETTDAESLTISLLSDILNKLDKIEGSI